MTTKLPVETIQNKIHLIRGHKVMLDYDLAELYHVPTKRLNEQVNRNIQRFPADFMFRLTLAEAQGMRSQIATGSKRNIRFLPLAFTEHGVAMLASVLNSQRAIKVNIAIVRAFIRLRELAANPQDIAAKIRDLETQLKRHNTKLKDHSNKIEKVFDAIYELMEPPVPTRKPIGFRK
jgi:hypothetical protein